MADDKIVQEYELRGVEEAESQLEKLADTGDKAFSKLADSAKQTENIGKGLDDAGKSAEGLKKVEDASEKMGASLRKVGETALDLGKQLPQLAVAAVTAFAAITGALVGLAKAAADATDKVRDAAIAAGTTTQNFQKLAFAAGQSGANTQRLERAFAVINTGGDRLQKTLDKFNVRLRDGAGNARDASVVFTEIAEAISKIDDPAQRSAAAAEIFGRRVGPGLVELLSQGQKGIADFGKEAARLGLIFTDTEIKVGDEFNDALSRLTETLSTVGTRIGLAFAPNLTKLIDKMTEAVIALAPHFIKIAEIIANNLLPALISLTEALGPTGTGIAAIGVAVTGLAVGVGILVKVLAPLAGIVKAGFSVFLTIGRAAVTVVLLLARSLGLIFTVLRVIATVGAVAFGGVAAAVIALAAVVGFLITLLVLKLDWKAIAQRATDAWNTIKSVVSSALQGIQSAFNSFIEFFRPAWNLIADLAVIAWAAITQAASALWEGLIVIWDAGAAVLSAVWETIKSAAEAVWSFIVDTATIMWDALRPLFQVGAAVLGAVWEAIKTAAGIAWDFIVQVATTMWEGLKTLWDIASRPIIAIWQTISDAAKAAFDFIASIVNPIINRIKVLWEWLVKVKNAFREFIGQAADQVRGQQTQAVAAAGGGYIRGPGTSTSDSIFAWLSDKEFVMRAAAVRKYGLGFMHAVNHGLFSLDKLQGFAMGGLVGAIGNELASAIPGGGNSRTPIVLQIGAEQFSLFAEEDSTAERLSRFAMGRRIRSGGRRPG